MSTNIVSIQILRSSPDFYLPPEAQMLIDPNKCPERWNGQASSWAGESSGSNYLEFFIPHVLTKFNGWADLLVVWETGDLEGLVVRDGHVQKSLVIVKLEKR